MSTPATRTARSVPVSLEEDYHVHSVFSDGVSTVTENVRVARQRGLRRICLVDHVRRDTAWVPDFVQAVQPLRELPGIDILAGVEAKILDRTGRLDLPGAPDALAGIDLVLIADHQFPADLGPVEPREMGAALRSGEVSAQEVIECLVEATASALGLLAHRARVTGAIVEVNEKWSCPSARTLRAFASADVRLVASTDSHDCKDIGRYASVARAVDVAFPGAA